MMLFLRPLDSNVRWKWSVILWAYPSGLRQLKAKPFESTPTRGDDEGEE
jgi:hypothetical protein